MEFGVFLSAVDLNEGRSAREIYRDMLDLAIEADRLGFDYVWLPEHDLVRFITNTSALQEAVLISAKTERVKLGSAVFVTPLYHPLVLAADIAEADNLTDGRFEPGFGRGGSKYELRQLQANLSEEDSKDRFREFCEVIKLAWGSAEAIEYHGRFFDFDNAFVLPRPYTDPHPPMWLATITPQSCETYAATGANVQYTPFRKPFSEVEDAFGAFQRGRGDGDGKFMVMRHTYVANTMEEARRILPLIDYHEHVIGAARLDGEAVVNGVREWQPGLDLGLPYETYLENLIIGDPATAVEKIRPYAELGVDQFCVHTTLGQDRALARRSLELFAEHVIPAFRDWPAVRTTKDPELNGGARWT
jgi:alkanesulfonate monooxygenase SsuD/methylene tetrahydromethanopterin reductase-like flavin-dependent oxidoreductase (luciferase family)